MISSVHILGDHSAHLKNPGYNAAQLPLTAEQQRLLNQKDWCLTLRDETIARLEMTIAKLKRWRFGRRLEKLSPDQILFLLAPLPQR